MQLYIMDGKYIHNTGEQRLWKNKISRMPT